MEATGANRGVSGYLENSLALSGGNPPAVTERAASPIGEVNGLGQLPAPSLRERALATFRSSYGAASALPEQRAEEHHNALGPPIEGERVAPSPYEGKRIFVETGRPSSLPRKRQKSGKNSISCLSKDILERIFFSLSFKDRKAVSMTCRAFRALFYECYQERCLQLLCQPKKFLLKQFGLHCPEGAAPSHAQMEGMVIRTRTILKSLKRGLRWFQEGTLPLYTATELVLLTPPDRLYSLLAEAYLCNLYSFFKCFAGLPVAGSLDEASQKIREWLGTPGATTLTSVWVWTGNLNFACLPKEISLLPKLQTLSLPTGYIATLPSALWRLKHLHTIAINNNELETLPSPKAGQLPKLAFLLLDHNRLRDLPCGFGLVQSLQQLHLSHNRLDHVPAAVYQLAQLQLLDLHANQIAKLSAEIGSLKNLRRLDLRGNRIATVPAEIEHVRRLRTLDLRKNPITAILVSDAFWRKVLDVRLDRLDALPPEAQRLLALYEEQHSEAPTEDDEPPA